jgi:hypothetical protein
MGKIKKILIVLLFLSLNIFSQTDWKVGSYYKSKGKDIIVCDTTLYEKYSLNNFGGKVLTGYYRKCKVLIWEEEYYTGYINTWFKNSWESEWADGNFWKCYWKEVNIKL